MSQQPQTLCHVGEFPNIVKEHIRQDVCQDLPIQYNVAHNQYCLLHAPTANKDQSEFERLLKDRISRGSSHFEAVVVPIPLDFSHSKFTLPLNFKNAKFLSNVSFYKAQVPYIYFDYAEFRALAQFHRCFFEVSRFTGVTFYREAWFTGCHFKSSAFDFAIFQGHTQFNGFARFLEATDFHSARFVGKTEFDTAVFECSVSFDEAVFAETSQVSFLTSTFQSEVSFRKAIFSGHVSFEGGSLQHVFAQGSSLNLRRAHIEPREKISFHSVRLQPHWFVATDARKFVFTNIKWRGERGLAPAVRSELSALESRVEPQSYESARLLSIALRQLADNSENNSRFEEGSMFRRMAMEAEWVAKRVRLRKWIRLVASHFRWARRQILKEANKGDRIRTAFHSVGDYCIHGLYRWTSYYGESWGWASFVLLLLVLVVFPAAYAITNFQTCPRDKPVSMALAICESEDAEIRRNCECTKSRLGFGEAIVHSLTTATFQTVDYRKPTTKKGETVVILEKIFAPLQFALLALALRRKFMR